MLFVYYLTACCLPVLLYYVTLKLHGNTQFWWKILLAALLLDFLNLFVWVDLVTHPLMRISGCMEQENSLEYCVKDAFFGAALTEELCKAAMVLILLFVFYRKRGFSADGIFKTTLASGCAFGWGETLGKIRYYVEKSEIRDYVWDSASYHLKTMSSLINAEVCHYLLALIMACFFAKAFNMTRWMKLILPLCALALTVTMHFTTDFTSGILHYYGIKGAMSHIIFYGLTILYIPVVILVWKKLKTKDEYGAALHNTACRSI